MMKLRLLCIVVLLTIWVLGILNCIEAEEGVIGTSSLALEAGNLVMSDDSLKGNNIMSIAFAQIIRHNFALKLSAGQTKVGIKQIGEITLTPLIGAIQLRIPMSNKPLLPYVEAGIGFYRTKVDFGKVEERFFQPYAAEVERRYPGVTIEPTVEGKFENKLANHFGVGLEYVVAKNFALSVNVRYLFLESKVESKLKATIKYLHSLSSVTEPLPAIDVDLNSWWILISAKMLFSAF